MSSHPTLTCRFMDIPFCCLVLPLKEHVQIPLNLKATHDSFMKGYINIAICSCLTTGLSRFHFHTHTIALQRLTNVHIIFCPCPHHFSFTWKTSHMQERITTPSHPLLTLDLWVLLKPNKDLKMQQKLLLSSIPQYRDLIYHHIIIIFCLTSHFPIRQMIHYQLCLSNAWAYPKSSVAKSSSAHRLHVFLGL